MSRIQVVITGPAGAGKSHLTQAIAKLVRKVDVHAWQVVDEGGQPVDYSDTTPEDHVARIPANTKISIKNKVQE